MKASGYISCIVVDDEFPAVKLLADYVQKTAGLKLLLKSTSAMEALDYINLHEVDLLFLDIQMPELTGLELMKIIKNTATKVILTTAYSEYAIDGFAHDAADYLLKPITLDRFLISVSKVAARIHAERGLSGLKKPQPLAYIFVKTEHRIQKVSLNTILYIEGLGDYITIHTSSGKILSLERMKNIEEILLSENFIRIHKSFIINKDHIDFIERGRIVINKVYLPVGDSYKEKIWQQLGLRK
ncbi:MAG: response regulator [Bacteroidota bacterium]